MPVIVQVKVHCCPEKDRCRPTFRQPEQHSALVKKAIFRVMTSQVVGASGNDNSPFQDYPHLSGRLHYTVCEISPHLCKKFDVFMREGGLARFTEISVFAT